MELEKIPPDPQHAILTKIYPWDEYNLTLIKVFLYAQAKSTGYMGTFEDFQTSYGTSISGDYYKKYTGKYQFSPMVNFDQILRTKNRVLEDNIIIEKIPYVEVSNSAGGQTAIIG